MGILEIAVAALSVMGGTTVGSAITGAVMGSRREIGAFRGFLWGLLLPVVGIGRVWISDRIVRHDNTERTRNDNGTSQIAAEAARKQYERDNPKRRYDRSVQVGPMNMQTGRSRTFQDQEDNNHNAELSAPEGASRSGRVRDVPFGQYPGTEPGQLLPRKHIRTVHTSSPEMGRIQINGSGSIQDRPEAIWRHYFIQCKGGGAGNPKETQQDIRQRHRGR